MLVLSRMVGEQIKIGKDVTVQVLSTKGKKVSLGIEAPSNVRILRKELDEHGPDQKSQSPDEDEGSREREDVRRKEDYTGEDRDAGQKIRH